MKIIVQLGALLFSAVILLTGNALQTTLLPLRAQAEAFSALSIGLLGSSYFVGFVGGCLTAAGMVRSVGHVRVFAAMSAVASIIPLFHILSLDEVHWWLLRAGTGFCIASLFLVIESWLNERSDNAVRGTVFSIYASLTFVAIMVGQILLSLYEPSSFTPFIVASIIISLAAVPVALIALPTPAPIPPGRLNPMRLLGLSPAGASGCFAAGVVGGAFWSLSPVAASSAGLDTGGIARFIGATVLGGALSQWPLGRLSDRMDRRVLIVASAGLSALTGLALFLAIRYWSPGVLPLAFAFGTFTFPVYSLSVAHVNDLITTESFVEISGGLLFLNGAGAVAGPLAGAIAMQLAGPSALFLATTITYMALSLLILLRIRSIARPVEMHSGDYVAAVDAGITAPVNYDPRNENVSESLGS